MSSEPDSKLISRFLKGDEEAFGMLMGRYERPLYYYLLRMVGDHDDASDLCQNTFVQVFSKARGFMARSLFRTWLYRIATNQALNHFRARSTRRSEPFEEGHAPAVNPAHEDLYPGSRESSRLRESINCLPGKQRATLVLRVYEDLSFREIGRVMGCSEGTAKVNYHHAIKALRKNVRKEDGLQEG